MVLGGYDVKRHFQQYFSYIVVVIFLWRKLEYLGKTTDLSQETDKLYHLMLYDHIFPQIIYVKDYTICGRRGRDRMVVGFMTTYAISAYHH
jgi:hypothetical protein